MAKKDEKTVQTQEQAQAAETTAPAPAAKKGDNPVDIFRDALMKTKREGMTDLLDFIQDIGFLDAPCSGGNNHAVLNLVVLRTTQQGNTDLFSVFQNVH